MIEAAKDFVAARGGRLIEAYPKDIAFSKAGANSLWMGVANTFHKARFDEVARRAPTRPIMRFDLSRSAPGEKKPGK